MSFFYNLKWFLKEEYQITEPGRKNENNQNNNDNNNNNINEAGGERKILLNGPHFQLWSDKALFTL